MKERVQKEHALMLMNALRAQQYVNQTLIVLIQRALMFVTVNQATNSTVTIVKILMNVHLEMNVVRLVEDHAMAFCVNKYMKSVVKKILDSLDSKWKFMSGSCEEAM